MGQTQSSQKSPLSNTFNLKEYTGTWYEIALFPLECESKCISVSVKYTLDKNSNCLKVKNVYNLNDSTSYSRTGVIFLPPEANTKNHLKLMFEDSSSDYWILETNYISYALVGTEKRDHVWILSRQPTMPYRIYSRLVNSLNKCYDYDTTKLVPYTNAVIPNSDTNFSVDV